MLLIHLIPYHACMAPLHCTCHVLDAAFGKLAILSGVIHPSMQLILEWLAST